MRIPRLEEITIGADPEFFLSRNGEFVPAEITGITGTKKEPLALSSGGAVQIDGCALEFNIRPAKDGDEFVSNIQATIADVRKLVDESLEFNFVPSVVFSTSVWEQTGGESKVLGCDPDYDAYTMNPKTPSQEAAQKPFRTAAGHIHVGFTSDADPADPKHLYDCAMLTQILDNYLGIYEPAWAPPSDRQKLYGAFGSFRPKPYGFEYRVLGNDWVSKPKAAKFIFHRVRQLVHDTLSGNNPYPLNKPEASSYIDACYLASSLCGAPNSVKKLVKEFVTSDEARLGGTDRYVEEERRRALRTNLEYYYRGV